MNPVERKNYAIQQRAQKIINFPDLFSDEDRAWLNSDAVQAVLPSHYKKIIGPIGPEKETE